MALNAIIHRKRSSWLQFFLEAPCLTLAKTLYAQRQRILTEQVLPGAASGITVVCVSDKHNNQPILPSGDVLVYAGDVTQNGTVEERQSQSTWLNAQSYMHEVVIAGNHDIVLDDKKLVEFGTFPRGRQSLRGALSHTSSNRRQT